MNKGVLVVMLLLVVLAIALFYKGAAGLVDALFGNTDLQIAQEKARQAEAEKDAAQITLGIEQEKTQQLALEAQLKTVEGDNMIKRAVAQSITWQTRLLIGLVCVVVMFALFGFGVALIFTVDWLLYRIRGKGVV